MKSFELPVTRRESLTKQNTKKLREEGMVPCVLYGGESNLHFSAPVLSFRGLIYTPDAHIVKINCDGETRQAILKDIQFHPVTDAILHIDFLEIHDDKPVEIQVPVKLTGTSEGVKQGGKLVTKVRKLRVKGLPGKFPDVVNVDITPLLIGDSVRVGDLKVDGLEFLDAPNNIIVGVRTTRNVVETPAEAAKGAAPAAPAAAEAGK